MEGIDGQGQLTNSVSALAATCTLTHHVHGWQQQTHQNTDNRDYDQQFNQRKTSLSS
jgi:hypothetical protein